MDFNFNFKWHTNVNADFALLKSRDNKSVLKFNSRKQKGMGILSSIIMLCVFLLIVHRVRR